MKIRLIKRFPNGSREVTYCDLLYRDQDSVVLRYFHTEDPYAAAAETVEISAWRDRNYILYRLIDINGRLRGYRFEVCCDIRFTEDSIERVDLGLFFSVDVLGQAQLFGEDVLADYEMKGFLNSTHHEAIREVRETLNNNYRAIIQEAEELKNRQ